MKFSPWRNRWAAYLTFGAFAALCAVLSAGVLTLQQSIVDGIEETRTAMVPKIQAEIRTLRNLEMLRHYGAVASQTTDEQVRRKVVYMSAVVAANSDIADERTHQLAVDADVLIRALASGAQGREQWSSMESRLSMRSDELSFSTGQQVLNRVAEIGNHSLQVRNLSAMLAVLLVGCIAVIAAVGYFLKVELKERKRLFNEASHDFRQRLHGVQLLVNTAQRTPPKAAQPVLLRIKAVMGELQRFLDNFLEIARMDAVAVRPEMQDVSVQKIFQRLEIQFEEVAKHKKVDIKFLHTRASICSDERILLRILENVVANAIKFARSRVLVAARHRDGKLEVWVIDNGPGMPQGRDHNLRREFVQGSGAPKPGMAGGGFGLGLSIVTRSAKLLGASVAFSSKADRGSRVSLRLPARAP